MRITTWLIPLIAGIYALNCNTTPTNDPLFPTFIGTRGNAAMCAICAFTILLFVVRQFVAWATDDERKKWEQKTRDKIKEDLKKERDAVLDEVMGKSK